MIDDEGYTIVNNVYTTHPTTLHRYLVYGNEHTEMVYAISEQHAKDLAKIFVGNVFFVQHLDKPC